MIRIVTDEPRFFSDLGDVLRLFYGDVTVSLEAGDVVFEHHFAEAGGLWTDTWASQGKQVALSRPVSDDAPLVVKRLRKRQVKQALYELLKALTGMRPPWGSLTGIRPTRLLYEAMEAGMGLEEAVAYVIETFDVSPDRAGLLGEIAQMQEGLRLAPAGCFDLYIGIPFCKTRCSYCSFSSGEIGDGRLVVPYVDALLREIELCRAMMEQAGLRLRAGYVGGGTPTAIPRDGLERILAAAQAAFPGAVEWTVEAGRPDTIDEGKLRMLKDRGVTRISVNPQTFSDDTLARIGRAHTGQQTVEAYRLARAMGFDDVNMDIIAALPGEGVADFARTLDVVQDLAPDSVTVHSLAIKRSSRLHEQLAVAGNGYGQVSRDGAAEMIAMAPPAPDRGRLEALLPVPAEVHGREPGKRGLRQAGQGLPVQHRQHGGDRQRAGAGRGGHYEVAVRYPRIVGVRRLQKPSRPFGAEDRARSQRAQHRRIHRPGGRDGPAEAGRHTEEVV
ncbi:MAG: coproporphyrinogen dehydrogenase HemZ [Clostridia bacterium]|nr:coproporphyrinogen dehydrogenase HemZ [Clostridia bacterium]